MAKKILVSIYVLFLSVALIISSTEYLPSNLLMAFVGFVFTGLLILGIVGYFLNNKILLGLHIVCMSIYSIYFLIAISILVMYDLSALLFGFGALVIIMGLNGYVIYFTTQQYKRG